MVPAGILLGLLAAFSIGLGDFFAASVSRNIGTLRTLLGVQIVGLISASIFFLITEGAKYHLAGSLLVNLAIGLGLGLLTTAAYLSFYKGLSIGPIAIVSPVSASYASVTVLLSLFVFHEALSIWQVLGIILTISGIVFVAIETSNLPKKFSWQLISDRTKHWIILGIILLSVFLILLSILPGTPFVQSWRIALLVCVASLLILILFLAAMELGAPNIRSVGKAMRHRFANILSLQSRSDEQSGAQPWQALVPNRGIALAFIAMVGFGLELFFLSDWTKTAGPLMPLLLARLFSVITLFAISFVRREWLWRGATAMTLTGIVLVGLLDTSGLVIYNYATTQEFTSIVATIVSAYALIPIILGIVIFRERLARIQVFGVAIILVGVVILGATS